VETRDEGEEMSVEIPWDEEADLRALQEKLDGLTAELQAFIGEPLMPTTMVVHCHDEGEPRCSCGHGWTDADRRELLGR
jgi:hypothetical protein